MTHLEIICEAYDRCGFVYVVLENGDGYQYLFLAGTYARKEQIEAKGCDAACREHPFIEFLYGAFASY